MNKVFILIVFLFATNYSNAQLVEFVETPLYPYKAILDGNNLYFATSYSGNPPAVSKIDITDPDLTITNLISYGFLTYGDMCLSGNTIYLADFDGYEIYKLDITDSNPSLTSLYSMIAHPKGVYIHGNDLYISSVSKIAKIDVTDTNPTLSTVILGLSNPGRMDLYGNDLYFTQSYYTSSTGYISKISKIDITDPNPVVVDVITGLSNADSLHFNGDYLYYSEYGGSNGGEISRINVTDTNPTPTSIINSLELITGISVNGNDMYITEENTGTIYKYTDSSLGIADTTYPKITISPNPSSNIIKVEGVRSPIKYTIHTITSNVIQKGVLSFDKTIDIKDLASGIYFLKFENKAVKKIIKK